MALTVADLIKEKEEATSVAYQSFVLLINMNPESLFCFFENKDAPYYHLRIKSNFNGKAEYISCGNKSMVKKAHRLINAHPEYSKYKTAFFIDRDFDNSIKDQFPTIYETPCYSIENLYFSVDTIKELLKTDFQIGEEDPIHNKILENYSDLEIQFLEASLLFNAWYKLQKNKSVSLGLPINISLNSTLIPSFIEFSLFGITQNYTLQTIVSKYPEPNSLPFNEEELAASIKVLKEMDLKLALRGKYNFNFMTLYIRTLLEDGADPAKRTTLTKKIKYNMDGSTALSLLTTYAKTPTCLINFLTRYN